MTDPAGAYVDAARSQAGPAFVESLLRLAERRIGPRDRNFTLVSVEFEDCAAPEIRYPDGRSEAHIRLTSAARHDAREFIFELSHEVFHLMAPTRLAINVLEEGLATEFSLDCLGRYGHRADALYVADANYRLALEGVRCLRWFEPALDARLTALRAAGFKLGSVSAATLASALKAPPELLSALAMPFSSLGTFHQDLARFLERVRGGTDGCIGRPPAKAT